ncbi:MAG: rhodanese-like domain-containing protein [Acetatifactor sp.]|nr:rhodanese-like domain-containing protein [Acetatifactor sp.]
MTDETVQTAGIGDKMSNHENGITTGEFIDLILRHFREAEDHGGNAAGENCGAEDYSGIAAGENCGAEDHRGNAAGENCGEEDDSGNAAGNFPGADIWRRGMEKGWLEERERLEAEKPIERRTAAKIVHEFLRRECGEADEADWGAAGRLKDLYDCRTCVNHVAQVYAKGIMTELSEDVFGMREGLQTEEAVEIAERLINRKRRRLPLDAGKDGALSRSLSLEQALALARGDSGAILVDVRSREAYVKEHLDGAVNIPFSVILEDPGAVAADRTALLLLYCDGGYQSDIAANRLAEAGYMQAYSFAARK